MPRPRLSPTPGLRLPRRTARLRLTVLYGGVCLVFGAVLLTVTYLLSWDALVAHPVPRPAAGATTQQVSQGGAPSGGGRSAGVGAEWGRARGAGGGKGNGGGGGLARRGGGGSRVRVGRAGWNRSSSTGNSC